METLQKGCFFSRTGYVGWRRTYVNLVGRMDGFHVIEYDADAGGPLDEYDCYGALEDWQESCELYHRTCREVAEACVIDIIDQSGIDGDDDVFGKVLIG